MLELTDNKIKELEKKANDVRQSIIEMLLLAGSGHTAGSLGMADIFTVMYCHVLKHNPKEPNWTERDRLILSNGHICPGLYSAMAHAGYFPVEELKTLRKLGSRLQGHPHREYLPGIETSSGPLGSGLSQGVGMALADRIDQGKASNRFIYCLTSDGEHNEGNTWEAVLLAAKEKLGNLIQIMDRNNIQIDGYTEDVLPLNPVREKYEAFNWHVVEIDGHNIEEIVDAIGEAQAVFDKPSLILANTIPGKGVSSFERRPEWHGKSPNTEEAKIALDQLRTLGGRITSEHE